jgi:hypothetical protein
LIPDLPSWCSYLPDYQDGGHLLLVALPCYLGDDTDRTYALVDTASEWCMISGTLAERKQLSLVPLGPVARLHSRFGLISGELARLPVRLISPDGQYVAVDATWFVSDDWVGPVVLGWRGFLERIRFVVDPAEERFYFAPL